MEVIGTPELNDLDGTGNTDPLHRSPHLQHWTLRRPVATRNTKNSRKAEESLPVELPQHFPESEPQPCDDHSYALSDSPTHLKARLSEALHRVESLEQEKLNAKARERRAKKTVKSLLEDLKKNNHVNEELKEKLDFHSDLQIDLFSKRGHEYTKDQREFAFTLHLHGPNAHSYLRDSLHLPLPHPHTLQRSQDATDLLSEDLVLVEQRVEPARKAAQIIHKKLTSCLQSQQGLDSDKRMKKLPLMMLSVSMAESFKDFDAESSIRKVLEMCCFMQNFLAQTLADFEMKLEKDVLEPLNKLSEEDLPEILRNKKQFAKLTTDWHNARTRSQASTGPQAKQDGLREEVEEAWRRLESIKDQYSADLYHFATKEDEYANYFIRLLELQAEHHRVSYEFLDKNITELKESHSQSEPQVGVSAGHVYGASLLSHLTSSGRDIALPIQECVNMLLHVGLREEGLFRLAAAASVVKKLKSSLDSGTVDHSEFDTDPHAVAGALKSYLRELPEPLMTFELYNDWFRAAGEKELDSKLEQLREVLKKLPPENYNNLRYLVQFLACLSEQQAVNRMTPSNIAIVLGPNLLWPRTEGETSLLDMASASSVQVVTVIEPLIQYANILFPEEIDFDIPELPELSPSLPQRNLSDSIFPPASVSKTDSTTSSNDFGPAIMVKTGPLNRGATVWESNIPAPVSQSSAQGPSPNPVPCHIQHQVQTSPQTQAQPQIQTQARTQLKASSPGEGSSGQAHGSPEPTLKITTPFKPRRSFIQPRSYRESVTITSGKSKAPISPLSQVGIPPTPVPRSIASALPTVPEAHTQPVAKTQAPPAPSASLPEAGPQRKAPGKRPKIPPPLPPQQLPKQLSSSVQ